HLRQTVPSGCVRSGSPLLPSPTSSRRLTESRSGRQDPVPHEYSIVSLTCTVTSRFDAVMVGLPGAAQDRLRDSSPATQCAPPEIFDRYSARELRISSAVFVQAKGGGSRSRCRFSRGCRLPGLGRTCGRRGGSSGRSGSRTNVPPG